MPATGKGRLCCDKKTMNKTIGRPKIEDIKIIGYRVLVEVDDPTRGGLVEIPDASRSGIDRTQGTVVNVGDGRLGHPHIGTIVDLPVKVGDRVWLSEFGTPRIIEGRIYTLVSAEDILGILPAHMDIISL